ncbi:MAG: NUDIX hydrolase, partial [Firmicutes bacterium]|nr:NUDIX hydrolase [Bacillota bacterium]
QYRKAAEQDILEIPAGRREDQEDPLVAAMRELREETGYTARKFSHLTSFYATIGYCTEVIHVYLATGLTPGETDFDEHEAIELETYPIDELKQMIFDGEIVDGKTITAILLAAEKLGL